jgi:hypothetical protein
MKNRGSIRKNTLSFSAQLASCFRTYVPFFYAKVVTPDITTTYHVTGTAISLDITYKEKARKDKDFDHLRGEKEFMEITK